jgi:Ran GTPase-activating protein (RanGAP) involved in mRNA processing and transport
VRPETFGAAEAEALFTGGRLAPETLGMGVFEMGLDVLEVLLRSPVLRRVRKLDLAQTIGQGNRSGRRAAEGARMLAAAGLDRVTELDLSWNSLGEAGAKALAGGFPGLRDLALHGNGIGPAGLRALAARGPKRLARLGVVNNPLGDHGPAILERAVFAPHLRQLLLGSTDLTAKGVEHLARSTAFPRLRRLSLNSTPLEAAGVKALLASPLAASLRCLTLDPDDIPARRRAEMRRHFGARLYLLVPSDY